MIRLNGRSGAWLGGIAGLGLTIVSAGIAQAAGPFASFAGNWSGAGTISVANGTKERLRCRAHYTVGGDGNTLSQNLTCASDSYKFNVVSNVQASGGSISGSWSETSRGVSGQISGRVGPTQISASISGGGFSAAFGMAARGGRQSITLRPTGTDITNVSVTMSKG